jgi:DNA-binding transcriptional LysR family regulator
MREFQQEFPGIQVNLLVSNDDLNLSRREADLAIRSTPSPPEHLISQKLFSLAWGAYATPAYLERAGRPGDCEALAQHDIIGCDGALLRLPTFDWLERHVPAHRVVARCSDLVAMAALAVAGLGIALLPDDQAKPELERLFTFTPGKFSDIWVLTHPDLRGNRRLRTFRNFIIRKFREDPVFQRYGIQR